MGSLLGRGGGSHGVPAGACGRVGVHMGSWRGGWGFTWGPCWAVGGFTWGPGGAVWGFFHMGWLRFHLNFCRAVGGFLKFAVTLEPPSP